MTDKSFGRFERGERVDQPDLQHAVEEAPRNLVTQLVEEVILGQDGAPTLLWGFDVTIASPVITVTRGAAITGYRHNGAAYRGMVAAGGPATRTTNVTTYADGTYGVFVRLSLRDSAVRNRRIWDALGAPAQAVTRLMATRIVEDWDLVLERSSPGAEYLQLGTVPITGGALGAFTRSVSRLFDSSRANRVLTDADWGTAGDRNAADTVGLRGMTRWTKMVMRQVQDIIGGGFYGSPITGTTAGVGARNLTQLNSEKLGRSGVQAMQGSINPDTTNAYDLGDAVAPTRWRTIYSHFLNALERVDIGDTTTPTISILRLVGTVGTGRGQISQDTTIAQMTITSGNTGQGDISLEGASVRLGRRCDGQGGIYIATGLTLAITGSAVGTQDYLNVTLSIGAATPIVVGDYVLFWQQTSGDDVNTAGLLQIMNVWVSGSNQLTIRLYNPDAIAAQPPFTINPVFTVVFLRRASG